MCSPSLQPCPIKCGIRLSIVGVLFVGSMIAGEHHGSAQEFDELPVPPENIAAKSEISVTPILQDRVDEPTTILDESGVETLVRGPLHEAFAEPITADPTPGLIIHREPPQEINELPPNYQPEGDRAIWISGYWGWDDQRDDFIWISGVYRVPPDGHRWVPGYWLTIDNGWQWVQGFWVSDSVETLEYFPPPPASLEVGPSSPAPGPEYFYVPGSWSGATSSVQWNPGYWHPIQDDFIWIPSHNVWTPRGCIYVPGYWDRRLPLRGLCFAPVYIPRSSYAVSNWHWQPTVVLNSQVVLHNLFVQPGYNHYVFGDYYGVPHSNSSTIPAYLYHQRRGNSDPLISFYTAYNARQGHDLIRWYGSQFAELSHTPSKRPPHTFPMARDSEKENRSMHRASSSDFAYSLNSLSKLDGAPRIAPVSPNINHELRNRDSDRKQLTIDRRTFERKPLENDRSPSPNRQGNWEVNRQRPLDVPKNVQSLRLPTLPEKNRGESIAREMLLKRPEPPRNKSADRMPKMPEPSNPMNQARPASGARLGTENLNANPFRSGSLRSDPLRSDPLRSDPLRSDPLRSDPLRSDPLRSDQLRPGPIENRTGTKSIPSLIPRTLDPNRTPQRTIDPNRTSSRPMDPNRTPPKTKDAERSTFSPSRPMTNTPPIRPNLPATPNLLEGRQKGGKTEAPRGGQPPAGENSGRERKKK